MILSGLLIGTLLGIVMQRGRFCVTNMMRDIFLSKSWRAFVGLMVVIAIHAVGIAALTSAGVIAPEYDNFAPLATVLGGFIFGLGIVLAGGCASGTWYRSGEGLVGSWIALVFYALSAAAMKTGPLKPFSTKLKSYQTDLTTIPASFGLSVWFFVIPFAALTLYLVQYFLRREAPVATLGGSAWKRPLHVYAAGAIVGLLGVIAWPLSAATGRNDGLGITTPSANLLNYLVTGNVKRFDWGVLLVLGILIGSYLAAKATNEFRVRVPSGGTAVKAVIGGVAMGVGAALAGGCTVGNGMVQTSLFTYQGWVALLFIALGVGAGTKLWLKPAAAEPIESAEDKVLAAQPAFAMAPVASALGAVSVAPAVSTKARSLGDGRFALDTLGAVCPFPLIEARDVMDTLEPGQELVIDFDCTQATDSIPRWAAFSGHKVTEFTQKDDAGWQIVVQKGK